MPDNFEYVPIRLFSDSRASVLAATIKIPFLRNTYGDLTPLTDNFSNRLIGEGEDAYRIYFMDSTGISSFPSSGFNENVTEYRLPDPDPSYAQSEDRYIVSETGSRITYRYYLNNGTPTVRMFLPQLYIDNNYITMSSLAPFSDRTFPGAVEVYFGMIGMDFLRWRYPDGDALWLPAYGMYLRPNLGSSFGDRVQRGGFTTDLWENSQELPNFKPTGGNAQSGGMGLGTYEGITDGEEMDVATRNGLFSFCSTDGNGLTCYRLSSRQAFLDVINGCYSLGAVKDNSYLRDALISAYLLPAMDADQLPTDEIHGIRVGDNTFLQEAQWPNQRVVTHMLSEEYSCSYTFGETGGWGDMNDFVSAKYTLYLPFVGSINIDSNAIALGSMTVKYTINAYNGNVVYWVYTTSMSSPTNTLYGTYSGNCAVQIPICGAGQSGSVLGKITNTVSSIATGAASIATGNIGGAINAGMNVIDNWVPTYNVDRAGNIDTNSTTQQAYEIRLKISKPVVLRDGTESDILRGRPSFYTTTLNNLPTGFHVISDINLDKVNASDAEKSKIKSILKGGIFA